MPHAFKHITHLLCVCTTVYGLVSRGVNVLAEYTTSTGNFSTVTRLLLKKLPSEDNRLSYLYDNHVFHYVVSDGMTYLCMSDKSSSRAQAFKFLEDLEETFRHTYGNRGKTARALAFDSDFKRTIKRLLEEYNGNDNLSLVQNQLEETTNIMLKNVESVLERGEKIEILAEDAIRINSEAIKYGKSARNLRKRYWWKDCKLKIMIAVVILIVLTIVLLSVCGVDFEDCS
jgi:vesicle-associated membrane protein 7